MDSVQLAPEITTCLGRPVCEYLKYHIKLNDYKRKLERIRGQLESKKEDIDSQLKVELLKHVRKVARKEVETWLKNAEEMISEAEAVENEVRNGSYLLRAYRGKLADEKTQELNEILVNAPNVSDSLVIDGPNVGLPLPTSELIGKKAVRDEIWSCLMQEEVSKIGVWGLGGAGKTTIMKHIHNDLLKEEKFEEVIWVTISRQFNPIKLQDDITRALRGGELPKEADKLERARILLEMLKQAEKHVLILDDVWDNVSLEEVGIPEPSSCCGCKLVLTTRSEQVCRYMGCKVIKVTPLSEEEALTLFLNKVGPNLFQIPTLKPILRLVVKECAGLPLTTVVVAGTLKGVKDPCIWKNALNELKERIGKVEGVEAAVIERLKFSFDHLEDEKVKNCFLYCALYPEDFEIEKDELIECWIDERLIDEMDTREKMKDKGHAILKKLEDNCLLENVDDFSIQPFVKMHDAVRDMALSITSMNRQYMIKAGLQLQKLPEEEEWTADIQKVSLMRNYISEIPIDLSPPKCQLLTTLLLQRNPITEIPDSFFANMPCLRVLNLSGMEIACLPNSTSELKNLTALLLGGCYKLKHLPSLSKLQELKKLDLRGTEIEKVPEGMEMLVNLRYLDLTVSNLIEIPAGLLPKLSRLQHLVLPEETSVRAEDAVLLEKLECFEGCFEDEHELNKFVSSMQQCKKNLIKYHIYVGSPCYLSEMDLQKKVVSIGDLEFCGGEFMLPIDIEQLNIFRCHTSRSLNDDISSLKNAIDLKECLIFNCEGIESVVSLSSFSSSCTHPFQSLEVLELWYLPKLSEVIKVEGFASPTSILALRTTFSHLKKIIIRECSSMKTLLPHWLLPNLQNLEEIEVDRCDQLVEILAVATSEEDLEDEEKGSDTLIKFNLPKLRKLRLISLPELKSICSKSVLVCDSLQVIGVYDCCKLNRIPPFLPLVGNGQPYAYAPPSLKIESSTEWWESLDWDDHPNFKNVLQPPCELDQDDGDSDYST